MIFLKQLLDYSYDLIFLCNHWVDLHQIKARGLSKNKALNEDELNER